MTHTDSQRLFTVQEYNRYSRAVTNSLHVLLQGTDTTVDIHSVTVNWWGYSFPRRPWRAWILQLHWPVPHPSPTCRLLCSLLSNGPPAPMVSLPSDGFNICPMPMARRLWLSWLDSYSAHQRVIKTCTGRLQRYTAAALVNRYMLAWGRVIIIPRATWPRQHILLSLWEAARLCSIYVRTW